MTQKALMAGIPVLAAVSAPSSLAVAFALGVLLGTVGAAAVMGRIDLLPHVPPGPFDFTR